MSRRDGFDHADLDCGLLADPKVVALARQQRDPSKTAATVTLYTAVILSSWREGRRLSLAEAAPAWWIADLEAPTADLQAVGLLDAEGRIPEHAWSTWFGRVHDRREYFRQLGSKGGTAPHPSQRTNDRAPGDRRLNRTLDRMVEQNTTSQDMTPPAGRALNTRVDRRRHETVESETERRVRLAARPAIKFPPFDEVMNPRTVPS